MSLLLSSLLSLFAVAAEPSGAAAPAPKPAAGAPTLSTTPAPAVTPTARLDLATVIDRVQKKYDGAADFRASFNQTLTNTAFKRRTPSTGEVLLKKPGRMRWNYKTPDPKMYLSDGDLLWLYEPEDKQAFKQDLKTSQLPAALAFLTGKGKLANEFDITFAKDPVVGTAKDYVLALVPKQAQAQVKSMLFVVDPETFFVRETMIVDGQGNTNDLLFSDIKINNRLPDATFRWSPPAGVRVVDTGKLGK
ncbi:MAG TPA: outer membrane lipoprotein chaperone LolA [Polyangia bacterium]|nr:outer membrane lipoprotein chaperone LolA [Polyangia bacterium]